MVLDSDDNHTGSRPKKVRMAIVVCMAGAIVIGVIAVWFAVMYPTIPDEQTKMWDDNVVFHVTLAEPSMYVDGVYTDTFYVERGDDRDGNDAGTNRDVYYFRFVPSGSSPEHLSITLDGSDIYFYEDFWLESTLQQTAISQYYTWNYTGQNTVIIPDGQQITITINPNGDVMGAVSVDMLPLQ